MKSSRTSDESVRAATFRGWDEWFSILDHAKATAMSHKDIAAFLYEKYLGPSKLPSGVNGGWWSQMVTVEYERARGMREVNEQLGGFSVIVHKTVPGSVASLQRAWHKLLESKKVKDKQLEPVPSKTKRAMLRYRAHIGEVYVYFDQRDGGKARIAVESTKLPKQSLVEPTRAFWKGILTTLEQS